MRLIFAFFGRHTEHTTKVYILIVLLECEKFCLSLIAVTFGLYSHFHKTTLTFHHSIQILCKKQICVACYWGEPEQAPHWRVTHTRFVANSVQEKYKQIQQTTLQVYHNRVSTWYMLGAINHDTERIFVLSTITRKVCDTCLVLSTMNGKHFGAINRNTESMWYVLGFFFPPGWPAPLATTPSTLMLWKC